LKRHSPFSLSCRIELPVKRVEGELAHASWPVLPAQQRNDRAPVPLWQTKETHFRTSVSGTSWSAPIERPGRAHVYSWWAGGGIGFRTLRLGRTRGSSPGNQVAAWWRRRLTFAAHQRPPALTRPSGAAAG
jgi:hypothetical protein